MRPMSVKQAERWLQKLKNDNPGAFKKFGMALKKYQKNDDEYECYIKMSHQLLQTPVLAKEINGYLEEGNKFVVNEAQEEKITKLMGYVKVNRPDKFREILVMIQEMSNKNREANVTVSAEETNKTLVACLRKIIQGEKELQQITSKALQSGEEQIASQDLQHLKVNHQPQNKPDEDNDDDASHVASRQNTGIKPAKQPVDKKSRQQYPLQEYTQRYPPRAAGPIGPTFAPLNPNEEKRNLKYLEKSIGPAAYDNIVKLIHLYQLCIITRTEVIDMIDFIESQYEFECLKDIIESREADRRKTGAFKPLNDNDFGMSQRASPSYVSVPTSYPIRCASRTDQLKKVMNDKWISVPYGSQETFNVRNKNPFETILLKSEDERYQFDLYTNKLAKAAQILEKCMFLVDQGNQKDGQNLKELIDKVIGMGVVQLIYKNATKQQKQELQWHLKSHLYQTCNLFKERIMAQLKQLKVIKEVHALKKWSEDASRNFIKSLDLKSFEFKKGEKEKMKGTSFIAQLNQRLKILENGGQQKLFSIPFEDKKSFFSIFNSFECSSKTERCLSRKLPSVNEYDMKQFKNKKALPVMIFAFEDQDACAHTYSLILYFIQASISNEGEKTRAKIFLEQILVRFFGWRTGVKKCLSTEFDEQKFHYKVSTIANPSTTPLREGLTEESDITRWVYSEDEPSYLNVDLDSHLEEEYERKMLRFNIRNDDERREFDYLPQKEGDCKILYASENFYIFLRFLYSLYERVIRMREVAQTQERRLLFDILFYNCIKTREGVKFQDNLNNLFGKQAYLFSTIYKLFENLTKSISAAAMCQMTAESLKYSRCIQSEQIYLLLMNRYNLENNLINARMIRLNFMPNNQVIYLNSLYSYYKCDEQQMRDQVKKRQEMGKSIQIYTLDIYKVSEQKKRKPNQMHQQNGIQYLFDSTTYKMSTIGQNQDVFLFTGKNTPQAKTTKRELKRTLKISTRLD